MGIYEELGIDFDELGCGRIESMHVIETKFDLFLTEIGLEKYELFVQLDTYGLAKEATMIDAITGDFELGLSY